jgi:hypothetical protein
MSEQLQMSPSGSNGDFVPYTTEDGLKRRSRSGKGGSDAP